MLKNKLSFVWFPSKVLQLFEACRCCLAAGISCCTFWPRRHPPQSYGTFQNIQVVEFTAFHVSSRTNDFSELMPKMASRDR
jgi:hypothetical protein